jgi:hypothetical protein
MADRACHCTREKNNMSGVGLLSCKRSYLLNVKQHRVGQPKDRKTIGSPENGR